MKQKIKQLHFIAVNARKCAFTCLRTCSGRSGLLLQAAANAGSGIGA